MEIEKVYFKTEDRAELVGLLHKGKQTKKIIISVHGMTSNCLKQRDDIIARIMTDYGIDYFSFNNRGHDIMSYLSKEESLGFAKYKMGEAYEDVEDGYYDIKAAIDEMKKKGYEEIYLQGHSLGCTKIVYTYNKFKKQNEEKYINDIKAIILLSLIDIPKAQKLSLEEKHQIALEYAEEKEKQNKLDELMPKEYFIHPISVKTYLRYFRDNEEIDFARYGDSEYDFRELNNIQIPLFMRWGNVFEMIEQPANELVKIVNNKVKNDKKDINYIDGANHGYSDKEEIVANQILNFLLKM